MRSVERHGEPALGRPRILRRERVWDGHMKVDRVLMRFADGREAWREVERHGDSVAVLPVDPARRCALLVRLARAPALYLDVETPFLEACAGMIDAGDADEIAAIRREAMEELGLSLREPQFLGRVWTSPGVIAERVSLFLADYAPADRVAPGGGLDDEHEGITVVEAPLAELGAAAEAGQIADAKLLMLIQTLRLRRPELF